MKGLVGGIPLALLVAAVQVQAMEHGVDNSANNHGFQQRRQFGGTALGGPSGPDVDGGFTSPESAHLKTHTNVNEFNKDDHSVKIKDTDVYPPPPPPIPYGPALGPGAGPFPEYPKRSWPQGGTAEGGPSGNDEGQSFDMPITGIFHTDVNEYNKDDHSVHVKNKDIHPAPVHPPVVAAVGPPPVVKGPAEPVFRNAAGNAPSDHFHVPATSFDKRWGPEAGGTALGGPGVGSEPEGHGPFVSGGTALGGPSGPDEGVGFDAGVTGHFHTNVNEASKDDHSIDIKHKDVYPPPALPFGPPFKRHWGPTEGGTALGGPSGPDEGIAFDAPVTGNFHTNVNEATKDDHSIALKNKDVYPPPVVPFGAPFKRHWGPSEGGTALGGPSGEDGGQSFSAPITIDTETSVNEDYEDDHSIDLQHKDEFVAPPRPPFGAGPPVRRAYSPDRVGGGGGGGTALGGPSGEDDGETFSDPTDVNVGANVNEHHVDNHAIKADSTDVHLPGYVYNDVPRMPWMEYPARPAAEPVVVPEHSTYSAPRPVYVSEPAQPPHYEAPAPHYEAPPAPAAPPAQPPVETIETPEQQPAPPREDHEEVPQCSAQVHEVVRTVTKTQYKEVQPTETVYKEIPVSHVVETSAIPMSAVPEVSGTQPKLFQSAAYASGYPSAPSSFPSYNYGSYPSSGASPSSYPSFDYGVTPSDTPSYDFGSFPSSAAAHGYNDGTSPSSFPSYGYGASPSSYPSYDYSASPSSYPSYDYGASPSSGSYPSFGAGYSRIPVHVPMATPSSSRYMASMATPASSMAPMVPSGMSPQQSSLPSAMPSSHGTMFTGAATRVSGGLVSAAAAMFGVLAFVL